MSLPSTETSFLDPAVPLGLVVEPTLEGTAYRWRILPKRISLLTFFGALALLFAAAAATLLFGGWNWLTQGAVGEGLVWVVGGLALLGATGHLLLILFGRCRLTLSPEFMRYEVLVFGRKLRRKSRELPSSQIEALRIKDPTQGGIEVTVQGADPFYFKLPVGAGAFALKELRWMKERWLEDLGGVDGSRDSRKGDST